MIPSAERPSVEIRVVKWPNRRMGITRVEVIGEDEFGQWLGVAKDTPWWMADGSDSGVFHDPLVKLVVPEAHWSACFNPVEPLVDVDIILPVTWTDGVLEEFDLELDVLRSGDGRTWIKDDDEFARVRRDFDLPDAIAEQALTTCQQLFDRVSQRDEPFDTVGQGWPNRYLAELGESY